MFTGIIESLGEVISTKKEGGNLLITIGSSLTPELKVDQSIAHNGVCLTVTRLLDNAYETVAVAETLQKTNLGQLIPGQQVNLERAMLFNGRIDGHLVPGPCRQRRRMPLRYPAGRQLGIPLPLSRNICRPAGGKGLYLP